MLYRECTAFLGKSLDMVLGGGGDVASFTLCRLQYYYFAWIDSLIKSPFCFQRPPIIQESIHASVKGGMKYNTGRLLMVLHKPLIPTGDFSGGYAEDPEMESRAMLPMP